MERARADNSVAPASRRCERRRLLLAHRRETTDDITCNASAHSSLFLTSHLSLLTSYAYVTRFPAILWATSVSTTMTMNRIQAMAQA